jgi:hypothetical protein
MNWFAIILIYLGYKLIDKFIEDNLPNLHYKRLFNFVLCYIFRGYISITGLRNSLFKKPASKEYIAFLTAIVISIKLAELRNQKGESLQTSN